MFVCFVVALSGCEETKKILGYQKSSPDEFQVVRNKPLIVPPEFDLVPPQTNVAEDTDVQVEKARSAVREALTGSGSLEQPHDRTSSRAKEVLVQELYGNGQSLDVSPSLPAGSPSDSE